MSADSPWPPAVRRALVGSVVAVLLALLWTAVQLGFDAPGFAETFGNRAVQLAMFAVILGFQRVGLLTGILAGIVLAFACVLLFEGEMSSYYWLGKFFLKSLKMIIVPLIFFAVVMSIAAMGDVRKLGRLGGRTVLYYAVTTGMAVVVGAILVNIIQPGVGFEAGDLHVPEHVAAKSELTLTDIALGFVSDNIVESLANMNMLPIIVFSLVFGAAVTMIGDKGKAVIAFCDGGNEAMMKIVHLLMALAPIGIFGLVAGRFGEAVADGGTEAFFGTLSKLALYAGTVVGGLAIHAIVVLPTILWVTTRRSPVAYARGMAGALLTAFSTASSAATMPLTIEATEENNHVDPRASQFVIPLGATVNMDGTALYEAVAVIFIAQALGIELSLGQQLLVILTATLAAIGAAGIPEAGLVTMLIVLRAVGLPFEGVEMILAIDWLLDRFRTTVNVWGDAVGAAVMEQHGLDPPAEQQAAH